MYQLSIMGAVLSLFPPVEAFIGVIKRVVNFNEPYPGLNSTKPIITNGLWYDDERAKHLPYTHAFSRAAVLLLTGFLIVGFIGALAIPLPGIAPLYGVGALGIAKACGITIGYTTAARTIGACFGIICDTYPVRAILKNFSEKSKSRLAVILKTTISDGISKIIGGLLTAYKNYKKQAAIKQNPKLDIPKSKTSSSYNTSKQNASRPEISPSSTLKGKNNTVYNIFHKNQHSVSSSIIDSDPEVRTTNNRRGIKK